MKLLIVTNLLPRYYIDFLNEIVSVSSELELTVCADISTEVVLNQYDSSICNFQVIDSKMNSVKGLVFRKHMLSIIGKSNFDMVCFYANPREITLSFVMLVLKLKRIDFISYGMYHKIGKMRFYTKLYYKFMGLISKKCFTYSTKGANVLLSLGVDKKKVVSIGTAIDERKIFFEKELLSDGDLGRFKLDTGIIDRTIVLQVVRLSRIKKPEMLIDAACRICSVNSNVDFYLIGDGEMYSEILSLIEKKGLADRVKLLGAIYDESVLAKWYLSARVFVMPTCIGLSAHHAMAYGLPIVTDDDLEEQASEFDILYNGLNCITYKSGDVQSMCDSILKIVQDDGLHEFLSTNATRTVRDVHTIRNKALSFVNAIVDI